MEFTKKEVIKLIATALARNDASVVDFIRPYIPEELRPQVEELMPARLAVKIYRQKPAETLGFKRVKSKIIVPLAIPIEDWDMFSEQVKLSFQ